MRFQARDHGTPDRFGGGLQGFDRKIVGVRFDFQRLKLLADGRDLLLEGGDVTDLAEPVIEQLFGARPFFLGSFLGAAVLIALPLEFGQRQAGELGGASGVGLTIRFLQLPREVVHELAERGAFIRLNPTALRL